MVRRLIGRPRPRLLGATGRANAPPLETIMQITFLLPADNASGVWKVPRTITNIKRVSAIQAGATGNDGSAKVGNGPGGAGGDFSLLNNIVTTPGTLFNFHVGTQQLNGQPATYSWFGGTSFIDAPLLAGHGALSFGAAHNSIGDAVFLGTLGLGSVGGNAGNFGGASWTSFGGQFAAPGAGGPMAIPGSDYGGGGGGGPLGGLPGQLGGFGIIVIELF